MWNHQFCPKIIFQYLHSSLFFSILEIAVQIGKQIVKQQWHVCIQPMRTAEYVSNVNPVVMQIWLCVDRSFSVLGIYLTQLLWIVSVRRTIFTLQILLCNCFSLWSIVLIRIYVASKPQRLHCCFSLVLRSKGGGLFVCFLSVAV